MIKTKNIGARRKKERSPSRRIREKRGKMSRMKDKGKRKKTKMEG